MDVRPASKEMPVAAKSGFPMLGLLPVLVAGAIGSFALADEVNDLALPGILLGIACALAFFFVIPGFFIVNPNMARVLVLFGRYRGTVRGDGFWWTNPFTVKTKVSVRAHNLNGQKLKVNDLLGNPIEIAAVVVWRVHDTAQAVFDVEKYSEYVEVQSESALRHLASKHPYDDGQSGEVKTSLRGSRDEVSEELQRELTERLARAGIEVLEAFLSHLAYAPEIASAMLQRQQASAVIAARAMIVEGAVGMVEHALQMLSERKVVDLDDERKAQMVGNLLVVLCSHSNPTPVLNTGSLYS
jgi:regulator of protease activity HflC (stomatin/prohibitin superfamily)